MKKLQKKIFVLFAAASLMLASCSDLNISSNEKQDVTVQNRAWVNFSLGSEARTILPSNIDKENYTYELYAQKEGEENKLLGTYTGYTALTQAFTSKIEIIPGNYTFTLKANSELGTTLTGETQKTIVTGDNSVSFTLEKVTSGTGTLEVAFTIPLKGAEKVTAQLCTLNGAAVAGYGEEKLELTNTSTNLKAVYKKQNVPSGDYVVKFYIYLNASDTEWIDVKTEVIKVASANQTIGQLEINKINDYFAIEYELNYGEWADGFTPLTKLNKKQAVSLPTTNDIKDYYGIPFYGWFDNEDLTGEPITVIEAGAIGNKKYYAKYAIACTASEVKTALSKVKKTNCDIIITDLDPALSTIKSSLINYSQINVNLDLSKCTKLTSINSSAFSSCSNLTSIKIPDSVTSIGFDAFSSCSNLTSIKIPDSVTSIGEGAFINCFRLTSVTIPDSVTSIGRSAFYGCSRLTSVTIPNGVTSIGKQTFWRCSGLTSVTIPDSVTSIGESAFYDCSGLTSVTIPDSVTSIGSSAFYGCSKLTSLTIPDSVTSMGDSVFESCRELTSISLSNSMKIISDSAFKNCSKLANIKIPNSITSIKSNAFEGCTILKDIYITNIENWCKISGLSDLLDYGVSEKNLYLNESLITDLIIPDSVTSINDYNFKGCSALTSITIPDSVTSIGWYAFKGCTNLKDIYITNIENWCKISGLSDLLDYGVSEKNLYLNESLITDLIIPDSVTSINQSAFKGCSALTSITIPDSVTSIGSSAFYGCSGLTSVTIPNSVTSIDRYAFYGCSGLTSITIPSSVTSIGNSAFDGCSGLTSVTIPDSVTSIGTYAFWNCSELTSITIPDSVTSIGSSAFYKVQHIYYNGNATGAPWGANAMN